MLLCNVDKYPFSTHNIAIYAIVAPATDIFIYNPFLIDFIFISKTKFIIYHTECAALFPCHSIEWIYECSYKLLYRITNSRPEGEFNFTNVSFDTCNLC